MNRQDLMEQVLMRGVCCSEALVRLGLALRGEENETFALASAGLCDGLHGGHLCGALTGGALLLAMFDRPFAARSMIPELTGWFDDIYGMEYGSMNCEDITGGDAHRKVEVCRPLIRAVGDKCVELLEQYGYLEKEASL